MSLLSLLSLLSQIIITLVMIIVGLALVLTFGMLGVFLFILLHSALVIYLGIPQNIEVQNPKKLEFEILFIPIAIMLYLFALTAPLWVSPLDVWRIVQHLSSTALIPDQLAMWADEFDETTTVFVAEEFLSVSRNNQRENIAVSNVISRILGLIAIPVLFGSTIIRSAYNFRHEALQIRNRRHLKLYKKSMKFSIAYLGFGLLGITLFEYYSIQTMFFRAINLYARLGAGSFALLVIFFWTLYTLVLQSTYIMLFRLR